MVITKLKSLFTDGLVLYIKIAKEHTSFPLNMASEFIKSVKSKINRQNTVLFLCTLVLISSHGYNKITQILWLNIKLFFLGGCDVFQSCLQCQSFDLMLRTTNYYYYMSYMSIKLFIKLRKWKTVNVPSLVEFIQMSWRLRIQSLKQHKFSVLTHTYNCNTQERCS